MPVPINTLLPTEEFKALCEAVNDATMRNSKQLEEDPYLRRLADKLRPLARRWGVHIL